MGEFKTGKSYMADDSGIPFITVLRRTPKTAVVTNGITEWRMRIWKDGSGNECMTDSTVPAKWRFAYTYSAKYEA